MEKHKIVFCPNSLFNMSNEARYLYKIYSGKDVSVEEFNNIERHDKFLVKIVEEIGNRTGDEFFKTEFKIIEIIGNKYKIIKDFDDFHDRFVALPSINSNNDSNFFVEI